MSEANVNDPASVTRVYPQDAFSRDAARNSVGNAAVLHGVRILSEPGPDGSFTLSEAKEAAGERDPEGDAVFLAPYAKESAPTPGNTSSYGGPRDASDAADREDGRAADYADFVDRIIGVARRVRFKTPDGQDERLKGFRGG